jgi:hypothetical protein
VESQESVKAIISVSSQETQVRVLWAIIVTCAIFLDLDYPYDSACLPICHESYCYRTLHPLSLAVSNHMTQGKTLLNDP